MRWVQVASVSLLCHASMVDPPTADWISPMGGAPSPSASISSSPKYLLAFFREMVRYCMVKCQAVISLQFYPPATIQFADSTPTTVRVQFYPQP